MFKGKSKRDRYLQPDEYKDLLTASEGDPEAHFFFMVMGATGVRSVEAERLSSKDFDKPRKGLWVWTAKRKDHPVRFVGVGKRVFRLISETVESRPRNGSLFFWQGKSMSRRQMKYVFKKYAELAEIRPALSVHSLRHFHGVACADAGMMPQEVAARLGHKKLDMVMEYFTLREDRNREIGEKFEREIFG